MKSASEVGLHQKSGYSRPAVEDAVRIEHRLQLAGAARAACASADGTRRPTCRPRETASHGRRCSAAQARTCARIGALARGEPAQRAAPLDQLLAAEVGVRRRRLAPTAATAACRPRAPPRRTDACDRAPLRQNASPSAHRLAAELASSRHATAGRAPDKAHRKRPVVIARRRQRQRLPAPFVDAADRLVGRAFERRASPPSSATAGT